MLSGAQIANRAAEAKGETPVSISKDSLVAKLVDLIAATGKNVSAIQKKKYGDMRRDQLEKLVGDMSKPKAVKKAEPKTEAK